MFVITMAFYGHAYITFTSLAFQVLHAIIAIRSHSAWSPKLFGAYNHTAFNDQIHRYRHGCLLVFPSILTVRTCLLSQNVCCRYENGDTACGKGARSLFCYTQNIALTDLWFIRSAGVFPLASSVQVFCGIALARPVPGESYRYSLSV